MGWGVRDYPQPVDDDLLSDGEYAMARREADELTQMKIAEALEDLDEATISDMIRSHLLDDECPHLATALAALYRHPRPGEAALDVKHELEKELHDIMSEDVKPVDVEDVLMRWHEVELAQDVDNRIDDCKEKQQCR